MCSLKKKESKSWEGLHLRGSVDERRACDGRRSPTSTSGARLTRVGPLLPARCQSSSQRTPPNAVECPSALTALLSVQRSLQPGRLTVQRAGQSPQLPAEAPDRVHAGQLSWNLGSSRLHHSAQNEPATLLNLSARPRPRFHAGAEVLSRELKSRATAPEGLARRPHFRLRVGERPEARRALKTTAGE
jgi:hypothetical protein